MGMERPNPSGEVAGHCKNNQRKNLDGRGWKKGEGKARNWRRKRRAAAPPTKGLQTAAQIPCWGYDRREAWASSREERAPGSRPAVRDGGPAGPPSPLPVCTGLRGLYLWVFIPIQEQMKTPSLGEGPIHTAERAVDPITKKGHS